MLCLKQKTAYEMRISDWSSDVCSSDLALAERAEQRGLEHAESPAEGCEDDGDAGQREGDRIADQDGSDQRREHHDVEVFGHAAFFARRRSRSRRTQARPCTMSRMQKAGISDFSRNEAGMPPTEIGPSSTAHELRTEGQVNQATTIIEGSRKPNAPARSIAARPP